MGEMNERMMYPVCLVFADWQRDGESIDTEEGVDLRMGDFHGGTMFDATITLDAEQVEDLRYALASGAEPVFYLIAREPAHAEEGDG